MNKLKDSGIPWIGQVPEHWDKASIKNLFHLVSGATPKSDNSNFWNGDVRWVTPADYCSDDHYVSQGRKNISKEGCASCATEVVPANSLIFSKRAPIGAVAIAASPLCTNQGCISCLPKEFAHSNYFYYLFRIATREFENLGSGTTFLEISASNFANFKIPLPPLSEQESIATYLDKKCGEIDELIEVEQQMIYDLEAYRKSVITEAVTKGLKPDVPLRDSGINWIDRLPAHWAERKISSLYNGIGSGTTPTSSNPLYYAEKGFNWLQTGDLNNGIIENTTKKITALAFKDFSSLKLYPQGSIVIAMYGATIGKVGKLNIETSTNQACCVLPPCTEINNSFAFYVFLGGKQALINSANGAGQPNISQDIIRTFRIPVPPLSEQQEIADYLDTKCAEIDELIKVKQEKIETLKQYRQSLIFEAVTGKTLITNNA